MSSMTAAIAPSFAGQTTLSALTMTITVLVGPTESSAPTKLATVGNKSLYGGAMWASHPTGVRRNAAVIGRRATWGPPYVWYGRRV